MSWRNADGKLQYGWWLHALTNDRYMIDGKLYTEKRSISLAYPTEEELNKAIDRYKMLQ